jgi:FkbM family methyltransferase
MTLLYRPLLAWYRRAGRQQRKVLKLLIEPVRRVLSRLGDPGYRVTIRGERMSLPVSHLLPLTIADHPLYDTLPGRVVACAGGAATALAVEAEPRYLEHLRRNVAAGMWSSSRSLLRGPDARVAVHADKGTARIAEDPGGGSIPKRTVDGIVAEHPAFGSVTFLKTDTDGNDFAVLLGAADTIRSSRPVILMECAPYDDPGYPDAVRGLIAAAAANGYSHVVAYDQYGNWFGSYSAADPTAIHPALAYQLISGFGYFDLLFLGPDDDALLRGERQFFADHVARHGGPALRGILGEG